VEQSRLKWEVLEERKEKGKLSDFETRGLIQEGSMMS